MHCPRFAAPGVSSPCACRDAGALSSSLAVRSRWEASAFSMTPDCRCADSAFPTSPNTATPAPSRCCRIACGCGRWRATACASKRRRCPSRRRQPALVPRRAGQLGGAGFLFELATLLRIESDLTIAVYEDAPLDFVLEQDAVGFFAYAASASRSTWRRTGAASIRTNARAGCVTGST